MPPPDWLQKDFRLLDDCIGLDSVGEGDELDEHGRSVIVYRQTDLGPGNSIDRTFMIWERIVPKPGVVTLGPPHGPTFKTAMYGIAAVELPASHPLGDVIGNVASADRSATDNLPFRTPSGRLRLLQQTP